FVGSAMQLLFMKNYIDSALLSKTAVLFIHSVNPYGFKYLRRVTENNIDLNRNSSVPDSLYTTINEGYPKVYDLINPHEPLEMGDFSKKFFFVSAINEIRKSSMPVLRQAVLQGQYQYPEGLYFGGKKQEPQIRDIKPIFEKYTAPYSEIFAIDMHTGYGQRGTLHLFPNPVDQNTRKRMEEIFEGYKIDWGDSKDFYIITGDFVNFLGQIIPDKEIIPISFEYGTKDSQTTLGSLKSIEIMIAENQGKQHGYATATDSTEILPVFVDMYFPDSEAWRSHCIDVTKQMY
ncbi:MAG TPA: hypothetical protein DCQ31_17510, partial [Bacteroidales bacterium]|nr:hypothetical protein [Bacteroidales bacterium]